MNKNFLNTMIVLQIFAVVDVAITSILVVVEDIWYWSVAVSGSIGIAIEAVVIILLSIEIKKWRRNR